MEASSQYIQLENVMNAEVNADPIIHYLPLYKAALNGNWKDAEKIFKRDNQALTVKISTLGETVLHVAVMTSQSIEFVQNLVEKITNIEMGDEFGNTALHYAAYAGNTEAAKILTTKSPRLLQLNNTCLENPIHLAAMNGHKETVSFLLSKARDKDPSLLLGKSGVTLINFLIIADFYDIAIDLLNHYPELARGVDCTGPSILQTLAQKPQAFQSGAPLGLWQRCLYQTWLAYTRSNDRGGSLKARDVENPRGTVSKEIQRNGIRKTHLQATKLLELVVSQVCIESNAKRLEKLLAEPLFLATKSGIHEFVAEIINAYPLSVLFLNRDGLTVFHLAIVHRQEKVFNLLYQMSSYKHFVTMYTDSRGNNMLHLAAKLSPTSRISGAALQMRWELLWFKKVENISLPSLREAKNWEGKTPREVFTEEHKNLVKQGENWMKGIAESYALVATLVITIAFAAAFTIPGGNNQGNGIPIFSREPSFVIFELSNASALFSSGTSLLIFLGILTWRYSEEDFLWSLPKRLIIGHIILFFSFASMLVAFSSALHLVLSQRMWWILVPIGLCAVVRAYTLI